MKRAAVTAVFLCAVAALGGCPIYNHDDQGCFRDRDCAPGYACDVGSGACFAPSNGQLCSRPTQCGVNQTCDKTGQCVFGDCTFSGCVAGYQCDSSSGIWACVPTQAGAAGAPGSAGAGSAPTGAEAGAAGQAGGG